MSSSASPGFISNKRIEFPFKGSYILCSVCMLAGGPEVGDDDDIW